MFTIGDHVQALRSVIMGVVLLLATTIIGLVWLSVGLYNCLSSCLGSTWGPIILSFIFFVPLFIVTLVKALTSGAQEAPQRARVNSYADTAAVDIAKIIGSLSGQSPLVVTSAAMIAGFLASRFPALLVVFVQIVAAYAEDQQARRQDKKTHTGE
jgi:hypothetical protein